MTKYDKPFKTYEELVQIMDDRNITINDKDFTIASLKNISYYTLLNGYQEVFLSADKVNFDDGVSFYDLYDLHSIDTTLGQILFKYILYIEKSLKSILSYVISKNHGVYTNRDDYINPCSLNKKKLSHKENDDYLCYKHYSNGSQKRNILRDISRNLDVNNPALHHSKSLIYYYDHHNHTPAWILTTSLSFGLTIKWYNILNGDDKNEVCNEFIQNKTLSAEQKKEFLSKALSILKEFRNSIAHGNRTYANFGNKRLPKSQTITLSNGIITKSMFKNSSSAKSGLLAVVISLLVLLNDPYKRANFINELENLFKPYEDSDVKFGKKSVLEVFKLPREIIVDLKNIYCN